nr:MAG TPA: hypothetical protein [Caudoviricetes sp.]
MCAYTDNSSFRRGSSNYLMQKLAGFSYVVRPFTRSRRSLRYPATSFPRILCCQPLSQRAIVCYC